jgi:hypothetical protein
VRRNDISIWRPVGRCKIEYSARITGSIFIAIDFPRFFGSLTREAMRQREV